MNDPDYVLYRKLMGSACNAMIAAGEARQTGDMEQWKTLVAKSAELQEMADKVNPFKKPPSGPANKTNTEVAN